jgi:hypothetical protein
MCSCIEHFALQKYIFAPAKCTNTFLHQKPKFSEKKQIKT